MRTPRLQGSKGESKQIVTGTSFSLRHKHPDTGIFKVKSGLLHSILTEGRTILVCPISTADGVKAADVAWAWAKSWREVGKRTCFLRAPKICVEVISQNGEAEMKEKMRLYFDAGAEEVWICSGAGEMKFYGRGGTMPIARVCAVP